MSRDMYTTALSVEGLRTLKTALQALFDPYTPRSDLGNTSLWISVLFPQAAGALHTFLLQQAAANQSTRCSGVAEMPVHSRF